MTCSLGNCCSIHLSYEGEGFTPQERVYVDDSGHYIMPYSPAVINAMCPTFPSRHTEIEVNAPGKEEDYQTRG